MPSSFEQQRDLIATFRSVARSLLASPEEPVLMKDLDGNLMRSRVRTVMSRLVELGFVEETRERAEGSHYSHLVWCIVDEPAKDFLERIVNDQVQTAKLLWPSGETPPEPAAAAHDVGEAAEASPQDPVALVAAVLEGFSDRLAAMEERTEATHAHMGQVAGGMSELIAAVSKVVARENPKPFDDTELLLALEEVKESHEKDRKIAEESAATTQAVVQLMRELAQVTVDVKLMLDRLVEEGIQARSEEMHRDFTLMVRALKKITDDFASWAPAMEECITGLKVVNKNQIAAMEEVSSLQSSIMQSLSAIAQGRGGTITVKPAVEMIEMAVLPKSRSGLGLKRGRGLPSLSQMVAKKDDAKIDGANGIALHLTRSLAEQMEDANIPHHRVSEEKDEEEPKGT
jgi:predicted transcriptional regulator